MSGGWSDPWSYVFQEAKGATRSLVRRGACCNAGEDELNCSCCRRGGTVKRHGERLLHTCTNYGNDL